MKSPREELTFKSECLTVFMKGYGLYSNRRKSLWVESKLNAVCFSPFLLQAVIVSRRQTRRSWMLWLWVSPRITVLSLIQEIGRLRSISSAYTFDPFRQSRHIYTFRNLDVKEDTCILPEDFKTKIVSRETNEHNMKILWKANRDPTRGFPYNGM